MNILAMETTGAYASVAVIDETQRVSSVHCDETLNHLRFLMPMVGEVLEKCGLQIGDVTAIAVSEGPGSFTGIRIGMAAAKALAQVLSIPVITVPTLRSFAYARFTEKSKVDLVCPIFDARRSQVYGGAYGFTETGQVTQGIKDGAYGLDEFLQLLTEALGECKNITFFGDGIRAYEKELEAWKNDRDRLQAIGDLSIRFAEEKNRYQDAEAIARLGYVLWQEGAAKSFFEVEPVYLRKAEAQRRLEESKG